MNWASSDEAMRGALTLLKPPSRISVSQSAEKYLRAPKGVTSDAFSLELTPYMRDPMNALGNRAIHTVGFCGPAQSGKTFALVFGGMVHNIMSDPADTMIVQMTKDEARTLSRQRLSRVIEVSPALNRMLGAANDDNVFDKRFKNGIFVNVGWPTISQLSSKPIARMVLTDYDRMPTNVNGEGSPYELARNRTKTFGSRGKTLVESSPGRDIVDPDFKPRGHEAPPCTGVLGLYNLGSKHRWYWHCKECEKPFLAEWDNLTWDKDCDDVVQAGESAHVVCPHCKTAHYPKDKHGLNAAGAWYSEYDMYGGSPRHDMATYWMQGIATPFQPWSTIVTNYLLALKDFALTGSQESLKATINTDQGRPYAVAKSAGDGLDAVVLKQRAEGYAEQRKVPAQARFLTTAVDVQKARFVVEVHAWGANKERWVVDRFNLTKSDRMGEDGERMKVQPFSYAEDWNCLDKLLDDEFEVEGTGVKVQSRMVVCDSGGGHDKETGTSSTANSYVYALRLRRLQKIARFSLIKGASSRSAARIAEGKAEVGKIKVPLRIINTTLLKDETNESLARTEAGAGYIHLPEWVGEWYFKELSAEVRTVTGWTKRRKADNNEAFDLMGYNAVAYSLCGGDKINWDNPPDWCAKPLGEQIPEKATVQRESNTNYLEYLRKRGQRLNGE